MVFKSAMITGASRGIGRAVALRLASLGYRLFLLGRDKTALNEVVELCRSSAASIHSLAGDLTESSFITESVAAAVASLGEIDVLVYNAGVSPHGPVYEANLTAWRSAMDLNFNAAVDLSRHILPGMVERKRGAIINISSISGRHTVAGGAIYAASKHALNGFGGCMYEDVREFGIKVSTIMPGFVDTELTSELGINSTKMIQPTDVADAVTYVLSTSLSCCPTEIVIRPQLRP